MQAYVSRHGGATRLAARTALVLLGTTCLFGLSGCGGTSAGVITALDGTFSNYEEASECFSDLDRAATVAAEHGSAFTFFAYDGDPLSRKGINFDFGRMEIPNSVKGTEKEDDYRVEQAAGVIDETHELVEGPVEGGTPLSGVLTRIARIAQSSGSVPAYVVNCGDGIWTDLDPEMSDREVAELADEIPTGLEGLTIDFVGLAMSDPGTGPWVEQLRPVVARVLEAKGASLGVYDIELPAGWPEDR